MPLPIVPAPITPIVLIAVIRTIMAFLADRRQCAAGLRQTGHILRTGRTRRGTARATACLHTIAVRRQRSCEGGSGAG
jgi:hypothetical protein